LNLICPAGLCEVCSTWKIRSWFYSEGLPDAF